MKPTILTALAFLCIMLGALMLLATAGDRLSARCAWAGLGLFAATIAAAVFFGWPTV